MAGPTAAAALRGWIRARNADLRRIRSTGQGLAHRPDDGDEHLDDKEDPPQQQGGSVLLVDPYALRLEWTKQ